LYVFIVILTLEKKTHAPIWGGGGQTKHAIKKQGAIQ